MHPAKRSWRRGCRWAGTLAGWQASASTAANGVPAAQAQACQAVPPLDTSTQQLQSHFSLNTHTPLPFTTSPIECSTRPPPVFLCLASHHTPSPFRYSVVTVQPCFPSGWASISLHACPLHAQLRNHSLKTVRTWSSLNLPKSLHFHVLRTGTTVAP